MQVNIPAVLTESDLQYLYARHTSHDAHAVGSLTGPDTLTAKGDEWESSHNKISRTLVIENHTTGRCALVILPEEPSLEEALVSLKRTILLDTEWLDSIAMEVISAHLKERGVRTLQGRSPLGFVQLDAEPLVAGGVCNMINVELDEDLVHLPEVQGVRAEMAVKTALRRFTEQVPGGAAYGELAIHLFEHFVSKGFLAVDVVIDDIAPVYHFHVLMVVPVWGDYHAKVTLTIRA